MNDIINSSLSLGEHNKQLPFYITKSEPKGTHAAYGLEEPNLGLQYLLILYIVYNGMCIMRLQIILIFQK